MRYAEYIAAFMVLLMNVSCTFKELDEPVNAGNQGNDSSVEVYARIANYSDCTVDTRSAKSPEEAKVSSMALAIFPISDGVLQPCLDYYYETGQKVTFTIDRSDSKYEGYADDDYFAMYVFANIPNDASIGAGKELTDFVNLTHTVQKEYYNNADFPGIPDSGFPMMGSLGDNVNTSADGKTLILKPTVSTNNPHALPLVNDNPTDLLNIPMESAYAKFSFAITIDPTQTVDGNLQSFTLESYTLHNIPSTVDFEKATNSDEGVLSDAVTINDNSVTVEGGGGEGAINFSFYVPERYLTPNISADAYEYPFGKGTGIREEDLRLRQRYKPNLVKAVDEKPAQKATYVTIKGEYIDHNSRRWTLEYDLYLGADNYGDFNVIRNTHYNNNVVIRGVQNSEDQAVNPGAVVIDHRVSIERALPIVENLRRETLLDSHFEVRPLRIRAKDASSVGKTVTVRIESNDGTGNLPDWIRLEHKNSPTDPTDNGYSGDYLSNGKRKYFTYGLVSGKEYGGGVENNNLSGSYEVTFTTRTVNDCVWIYVDECTDTYSYTNNPDGTIDVQVEPRSARIVIDVEGEEDNPANPAVYEINQSKLYPVPYPEDNTKLYKIESYEEYLYNYDAEDLHSSNQTFYEGMPWGLEGVQLSHQHVAADPSKGNLNNYSSVTNSGKNTMNGWVDSYYDFYNERHDSYIPTPDAKHVRAGQEFCDEIIVTANIDDNIDDLTLEGQPDSAIKYCYNKNKRNRDGSVASSDWYLPAIDEIEDVMANAYNAFDGVFQDQDYWSCQPSYHRCFFFMSWQSWIYTGNKQVAGNFDFYIDDIIRARSTRARFSGDYDVNGKPEYTYNPSGIDIPYEDPVNKVYPKETRNNVEFTIQKGYYQWKSRRGTSSGNGPENEKTNYNTDPPSDSYDHVNAYVSNRPVWPEFGEDPYRQNGSRERTDSNRVRCIYKEK